MKIGSKVLYFVASGLSDSPQVGIITNVWVYDSPPSIYQIDKVYVRRDDLVVEVSEGASAKQIKALKTILGKR